MFSLRRSKSYITVLDIGTSKVCGFMAHIQSDNRPEIVGVGYAAAKGIKAGAISNLEKATECISSVIGQIERQAGRSVDSVTVNISSGQLRSRHLSKEVALDNSRPITSADIRHLVDSIIETAVSGDEEVLHPFPSGYAIDNEPGYNPDPRGLFANTLKAYVHVITIPETQLRNLVMVLDRCHVSIDKKVATPYASGLAVLTEEEKDVGATVIDMGAGTTSYAQFMNGSLVHLGLVPKGGDAMTRDIAQIFSTSPAEAERLKTREGAAFLSPRDEIDHVIVPMIGEEKETNKQVRRADLIQVIVPQLEDILEQVDQQLNKRELFSVAARRIVLCGGGSELQGIKEKTEAVLRANARLGKPHPIKSLPNQFDSYRFLTCIGLLKYVLSTATPKIGKQFDKPEKQKSRLRKVLQWLVK